MKLFQIPNCNLTRVTVDLVNLNTKKYSVMILITFFYFLSLVRYPVYLDISLYNHTRVPCVSTSRSKKERINSDWVLSQLSFCVSKNLLYRSSGLTQVWDHRSMRWYKAWLSPMYFTLCLALRGRVPNKENLFITNPQSSIILQRFISSHVVRLSLDGCNSL